MHVYFNFFSLFYIQFVFWEFLGCFWLDLFLVVASSVYIRSLTKLLHHYQPKRDSKNCILTTLSISLAFFCNNQNGPAKNAHTIWSLVRPNLHQRQLKIKTQNT